MDSKAYKYLIADIIGNAKRLSDSLPVQFYSSNIGLSDDAFKAVAYFLTRCIPGPDVDEAGGFPLPEILTASDDNFFTILFRLAHQRVAEELIGKNEISDPAFKYNGTELLKFLCNAASPKWVPVFSDEDVLSLAMSCFLIEACMNLGWCPNGFEDRAKRAAHIYFSNLKKSLYRASDTGLSTIVGYLHSAWLCAQKTEGIQDKVPEWENRDSMFQYSWELPVNDTRFKSSLAMYKFPGNSMVFIIPKYHNRIPHPFTRLVNEHKTGLTLYCEDKPVIPAELVEQTPIDRPKIRGGKFIYTCDISASRQIKWLVAIQVFNNTIYRIDVIRPKTGKCLISNPELRIENSIPLSKASTDAYQGKGHINTVVEFLKNPFSFDYYGQEGKDISLFKGQKLTLSSETPVEMITAWSTGKNVNSIDRTHLLGIFDI